MKSVKITCWLMGLCLLGESCSTQLRINATNEQTYTSSVQAIRKDLTKEEILTFETDIVVLLFGELFLQDNVSQQLSSIFGTRHLREEDLIKDLHKLTYENIKKKSLEIQHDFKEKRKDKIIAYQNGEIIFEKIKIDSIVYAHKPYSNTSENLYPYLEFNMTNKTGFAISSLSGKAIITNEEKPFYEAKFNYKFKDLLSAKKTDKIKILLSEFNDLTPVNIYVEGVATIQLKEIFDKKGKSKALVLNETPKETSLKDALSLMWFNLNMTKSYLLGLMEE